MCYTEFYPLIIVSVTFKLKTVLINHPNFPTPVVLDSHLESSLCRLTCALRGVQAARQLLQESRPGRIPAMLLALVMLLRHQRVVEPGAAQAAVLSRLPAAVAAHHRRRPGHVGVGRRARGWVCRNRGRWGAIWGEVAGEKAGGGIRDYIHNHSDANERSAPVRGRRLR